MIKITYHRTKHVVEAKGHSSSAPQGEDLICAAVTILIRTLAKCCVNDEQAKKMRDVSIVLEEGYSKISAVSIPKLDAVVTLRFDTVCCGLELLAKQYPEYVAFQIV